MVPGPVAQKAGEMLDSTLPQDPDAWPREAGQSRHLDAGGPTPLVLGQSLLDLQAQEVTDSSLSVVLAGRDGQVLAASSTVHEVLRREPGDLVGRPVLEALRSTVEADRARLILALDGGEVGEPSRSWEGHIDAAGQPQRCRIDSRRVGMAGSDALWCSVTAIADDEDDRVAAGATWRAMLDAATQSEASISQSDAQSEARQSVPGEVLSHVVAVLRSNARRELDLVEHVLLMGAVQSGTVEVRPARCSVRTGVLAAIADRAELAVRHRVGVAVDLDRAPEVTADPDLLGTCLDQIISNAMRFSAPLGTATCSWREEGGCLVVRVDNPVTGIDQAVIDRAFDPWFRRTAQQEEQDPGIGLGLGIARGLARLMGGDVSLHLETPVPVAPNELSVVAPAVYCELTLPLA